MAGTVPPVEQKKKKKIKQRGGGGVDIGAYNMKTMNVIGNNVEDMTCGNSVERFLAERQHLHTRR